ncbi:erythromycin esterase family protein [Sorangium sp. So ce388]|uniref:erythromycin esterase family protein n=1 Tax=Sorangium sp. So ce388 TaxID=3133309 RepID=UPI003F5C7227
MTTRSRNALSPATPRPIFPVVPLTWTRAREEPPAPPLPRADSCTEFQCLQAEAAHEPRARSPGGGVTGLPFASAASPSRRAAQGSPRSGAGFGRRTGAIAALLGSLALAGCSSDPRGQEPAGDPLDPPAGGTAWVIREATPITTTDPVEDDADMEAFGDLLGSAKVAGLGESAHVLHELNQMRIRLLKYLVERKGFRAIVLESGIIEGRLAERYVQGDPDITVEDAMIGGFTHGAGLYEEVRGMLEWMRTYNASQRDADDNVHYYGMDLTVRGDAPVTALELLAPYLAKVDPAYAEAEFSELLSLAERANQVTEEVQRYYERLGEDHIPGNYLDGFTSVSFEQLSEDEQAALEDGIERLNERLAANEAAYASASSSEEHAWASHAGLLASQMLRDLRSRQAHPAIVYFDENMRVLEAVYKDRQPELTIDQRHFMRLDDVEAYKVYFKGRETRELALAENLAWVQSRHGKTMVYAHNFHLLKTEVDITVGDVALGKLGTKGAGQFIAERFGDDYVLIAGTMDTILDPTGAPLPPEQWPPDFIPTSQCDRCMEKALAKAAEARASSALLLDLRTASGEARAWLLDDIDSRWQGSFQKLSPIRAFDGVFFVSGVTPSRPYQPGSPAGE